MTDQNAEGMTARSDEVGDALIAEMSACNERLNSAMLEWKSRALSAASRLSEVEAETRRHFDHAAKCERIAAEATSRLSEMEKALEEIASDVGFLLRAIEDQDPYGELRLRVRDITMLVRDARSALRSKQEERSPNTDTSS